MKKILFCITLFPLTSSYAQQADTVISPVQPADSLVVGDSLSVQPQKKPSGLARWWNSLINGNVDRTFERPIDLTLAVAPYYQADTGASLVAQLSALYRVDRTDSLLHVSDLSLSGGVSWNGTCNVAVQGNHHFNRQQRLTYSGEFRRQVREFWGIDYADCDVHPSTMMRDLRATLKADYQQRIGQSGWFWGAAVRIRYNTADADDLSFLNGQDNRGFYAGLGPLIQYDTRDFSLNPKRGFYLLFRDIFYPDFFGMNKNWIAQTTFQFSAYHPAWTGATFAYDFFFEGSASKGTIPWQLREIACEDDRRMRGYQAGRYIDTNQMSAQFELRQHVWGRFGLAAWGGVGTFYDALSDINPDRILPTYGIGLRFEFKHNTNIRLDCGWGRDSNTIIFNFGEAF